MKNGKRCLALLLCAALLVGMMGVLALPASAASETCQHTMTTRTVTRYDCVYGSCETAITQCSKCGFTYMTASRPAGAYAHGEHHFITKTFPSETCPTHGAQVRECAACGFVELITTGGHQWSTWETVSGGTGSCAAKEEQRTCACGAVENRSSGGHNWQTTYTNATCTEPGKKVQTCSVCGERSETVTQPALGHLYKSGTLCTDERTCTRCGDTQPGVSHTLKYVDTAEGHYQSCSRCSYTTPVTKHSDSGDGYCVCGRQVSSGKCSHNWTIERQTSAFTHQEKCTRCGATRSVNCTQSTIYTPRTDCTTTEYCSCGNVRREPQKNHNFGTWRCTDSTHTHACLNSGCQYGGTPEPHTFQTVSGIKKCVVCNYTDPKSLASHTHVWGAWTSNGSGGHSHSCTIPGCNATENSVHNLGAANCKGEAVCKDCGDTVTSRPAGSTHAGGTEVRDAKAAQVGVAGYTGDTYCLGCGKKISSGSSIPALNPGHTHSYSTGWTTDGAHHWKACSCGDKQDYAGHTFTEGVCTVCGYKDPSYADAGRQPSTQDPETQKPETQKPETQKPETQKPSTKEDFQAEAAKQFNDVKEKDYFSSAVGWAVTYNITNGTKGKTFAPNETCSQIQILTMLYRAQRGSGAADKADMDAAVAWATAKGIIGSDFDRDAPCTRATAVTYMWKAANSPKAGTPAFSDVSGSAGYAQAVAWAVSNGVTNGTSKTEFSPNDPCNRSQIVTFLYREAVEPLQK